MHSGAVVFGRKQVVSFLVAAISLLSAHARADLWVTGYYPGYQQSTMAASNIDFTTITHVIHFALIPNSNGSLNSSANSLTPANAANLIALAHGAGRKAIVCVGGASSETGFQGATTSANLPAFINNLTNFVATYGYDGIDVDWEPLPASDANQYTNLVNGLRAALNRFSQHKLLTVAAPAYPVYGDPPTAEAAMFASLQAQFDQINIMTYDLSGPYEGWVTWFNSPIYDGGYRFPSSGGLVPSVNGAVSNFITKGVSPAKLGIGLPFYGYIWTGGPGVTSPRQSWPTNSVPTVSTPSYTTIMTTYFQSNNYHWDTNAQAAYLVITNTPPAKDDFISYDDQHTIQAKVSYARNHSLGGIMIWELSEDYFPSQPVGQRAPLVQTLKQSLGTPGLTSIQMDGQDVNLSFYSLPLADYRVQWTSNLAGTWFTLTNNVPGTGGILQISDPAPQTQPERFYRIQTPP